MNIETIFRLLHNSGFQNLSADSVNIYMEDPGCIIRSFQTFFDYAWTILIFITGILLAGWAWAMIRGSKNAQLASLTNNIRSLVFIFATISIVPVFVNTIYGGDLIGLGCKTISVPLEKVNALLELRKAELEKYDAYSLYEEFDIYDSGVNMNMAEMPYLDVPLAASGSPGVAYDWTSASVSETTANQLLNGGKTTANKVISILDKSGVANMTPVRAVQSGKDVIFIAADNTKYKQVGGTRAWRNNNPGNIRMYDFARRAGAIGEAGGFAVFPDEATGLRAVKSLLLSSSYKDLTIANAISRYAPPAENNTVAYQRSIERLTGLSINRKISDLNDLELDKVVNAIRHIEGWQPGQVIKI